MIVSDVDDARLEFATKLGADVVLNPRRSDLASVVHDFTEGRGADAVMLTASSEDAGRQGLELAGRRGRVVFFASLAAGRLDLDWNRVHYEEIVITGAFSKTEREYAEAARLLASGAIRLRPLISKCISQAELPAELEATPSGADQRLLVRY